MTYVTDNTTFSGLDGTGSSSDMVAFNSVVGGITDSGTDLVNTLDFSVSSTRAIPGIYNGFFTETASADGSPFSYTVPYTLTIGLADSLVIGGNDGTFAGYAAHFNTLTFSNVSNGTTVYGDLTATVATAPATVPEPAAWALMVVGLGLVGGTLRRRTRRA